MSYFNSFPTVKYQFSSTEKTADVEFTNIVSFSEVFEGVADDESLYQFYDVADGERPDIVSQRLYDTPEYYWTFYLLNDGLRQCGWPLSYDSLLAKLNEDIPGECLVFLPSVVDLGDETNFQQHAMIEQFAVGDSIFGQQSGASGVVYARNVNLGQMFVRKTNTIPFQANEVVVDVVAGAPNSQLTVRIVHSPAHLAYHHFEDGDGDHVDVDYAVDFRGRGPEGATDLIGGVFDDLVTPDVYANSAPYTGITFREFYEEKNADLSRIKVLRPGTTAKFVALHNKSMAR